MFIPLRILQEANTISLERERFYGDIMLPEITKLAQVFIWSTQRCYRILSRFFKTSTVLNFMEIFPVRAALIHADGWRDRWKENRRTDITKTIGAFRHYANAPSKSLCRAGPYSTTVVDSAGGGGGVMQRKILGPLLKILFENRLEKQWC